MNGFDLDQKPPVPTSSTPTRRPDATQPDKPREKAQAGPDQAARRPDFSTLHMRAGDEGVPTAATGQQTKPAQGAPGGPAAPVAAPTGGAANADAAAAGRQDVRKTGADAWSETCDRFAHNRSDLTPAHRRRIEALAAAISTRLTLATGSRARVSIKGHTDTSGDEARNLALGMQRAEAARSALSLALSKYRLGANQLTPILAESMGESQPVNAAGDGVKDAGNRRVEITVTIEGPAPSPTPKPVARVQPRPPVLTLPPDYDPTPPGPRRRDDNWWQRAEENQRRIERFDRQHPRKPKSINDVLVDGVTRALEPVIARLPRSLRNKAREGIRAGIEKGTEAGCDAAIDASGVNGEQAEAIKAACHAALQTKPGGKP